MYVRRELTHADGAFFAAQDADSEGHEEGRFFVWDRGRLPRYWAPTWVRCSAGTMA